MLSSLSFLNKLTSNTLKFRSAIVSAFISFFAPLYLVLCATYFFIIFDWIYGYRVSRKYGYKKIQHMYIGTRTHNALAQRRNRLVVCIEFNIIFYTY